ncbi:60S ribosomal protein L30-like [Drosophila obscura]|uniref:60S ribosomal protein L30-like n=1 Tax=Drosophila obscura TaxID=7282 RepID=UPI001BB0F841|nr:60S ribosomal protein L30-like [Drosophila obscura]
MNRTDATKREQKGLNKVRPGLLPPKTSTNKEIAKKTIGNKKKFECINSVRLNIRMTVKVNCSEVFCSHRRMMRSIREHRAKVVIVATKVSSKKKAEIDHYAKIAKIPVVCYAGPWIECTNGWGKVFHLPIVALITPKDAGIIRSLAEKLVAGIALFLDGRYLEK